MEASSRCSAYGAGSIPAKPIGYEPFAREQRLPSVMRLPIPGSVPGELARDAVEDPAVWRVLSTTIKDRYVLRFDQGGYYLSLSIVAGASTVADSL